jgi:hypothetical protein
MSVSASFASLAAAENAARLLIERGIPEPAITLEDREDELMQTLSLGAGVSVDATESLIEAKGDEERFTLTVDTAGDLNREDVCRQIFAPSTSSS